MSEIKTRRSFSGKSAKLYQLKITLSGLSIWRRLLVRGDMNLGLLHTVIQVAMGWTNSHLHAFSIGNETYSDIDLNEGGFFGEPPDLDERKAILMKIVPREKAKFIYEYDFGDSWRHSITVEKILEPDAEHKGFAECLGGKGACPPEDCGGIGGYAYLLDVIKNPKHKEYESMMQWLGGGFDPDEFDIEKINKHLKKLKWPHTTVNQLARILMARDGV
ncbi:MAG TPA: plasmid pRiA4b ORF-3 family protein [Candidatus Hydrogenedentes bacterium]|nr:plasmid pRiA4b ORF-3 family protein [Candidatus Hydrogenedentota bacterium]